MRSLWTGYQRPFLGLVLAQAIAVGVPLPAWGQIKSWTTVGSAGTVDASNIAAVSFDHGAAVLNGIGSATIRYNVVAVDGVFTDENNPLLAMQVLYKAPSSGASLLLRSGRVQARLVQVDLASGAETTLLTFDSNNFPALNDIGEHSSCATGLSLDFFNNAYYVEVVLSRSRFLASTGQPAFKGMLLVRVSGCGD